MTKQELRKLYLDKRQQLSEAAYLSACHQLCEYFFAAIDLSFVRVVHVFLPIEKKREPNTWLIIDRIRREFPHIRLVVPRVNAATGEMDNFFYEGLHQLEHNAWGIAEPRQGVPAPTEKIDMVLIPLLAFDHQGNRVGYGKGFYDKFLAQCRANCRRIGLSLFPPIEHIDDIDVLDQPLEYAVTPQGVLRLPLPASSTL